jgi:Fe-S cluster assembly protein SufD
MQKQLDLLKTNLLNSIRSSGLSTDELLQGLEKFTLPHRRMEEWKYSVPVFKSEVYQVANPSPEAILPAGLPDQATKLVFSGGCFLPELSSKSLPAGMEISSMTVFPTIKPFEDNFFSRLNEATAANFGLKITIAANARIEEPVLLIHCKGNSADNRWIQPHISVEAGTNSLVSFAEMHEGEANGVVNLINQISLAAGAVLNWLNFENNAAGSVLINQTRAKLDADAQFRHSVVCTAKGFVRNNLDVHISGLGAHADLFGLSLGIGSSHCDHHSFIHHAVENTTSNQLYKGVFAGKSTGVFNGKILVDQEAQKTNAYQSGRNLLLSADARVFAKPQLEIFADDVKCSHGATIGQLDDEPLFYLRSRGLDLATARLLLVRAFASEILMEISSETLREFTENLAIARLDEMTREI